LMASITRDSAIESEESCTASVIRAVCKGTRSDKVDEEEEEEDEEEEEEEDEDEDEEEEDEDEGLSRNPKEGFIA